MKTLVLTGLLAALLTGCNTDWRGRRGSEDRKRNIYEHSYRLAEHLIDLRDDNISLYLAVKEDLKNLEEMIEKLEDLEDNVDAEEEFAETLDALEKRVSLLEAKICEMEKGQARHLVNPPKPITIQSAECFALLLPKKDEGEEKEAAKGAEAKGAEGVEALTAADGDQEGGEAPPEDADGAGEQPTNADNDQTADSQAARETVEQNPTSGGAELGSDSSSPAADG